MLHESCDVTLSRWLCVSEMSSCPSLSSPTCWQFPAVSPPYTPTQVSTCLAPHHCTMHLFKSLPMVMVSWHELTYPSVWEYVPDHPCAGESVCTCCNTGYSRYLTRALALEWAHQHFRRIKWPMKPWPCLPSGATTTLVLFHWKSWDLTYLCAHVATFTVKGGIRKLIPIPFHVCA